MRLKILLAIGIVLIFAGLGGCLPPEEELDLPRYTEAQVTTAVSNYLEAGDYDYHCYAESASYEGNGAWEVTC